MEIRHANEPDSNIHSPYDNPSNFDDILDLARLVGGVPFAALVWFSSSTDAAQAQLQTPQGTVQTEIPAGPLITAMTGNGIHCWTVEDVQADPEWSAHPWVTGTPSVRALAGAPITCADGTAAGAVLVMAPDTQTFTPAQQRGLLHLSRQAGRMVDLFCHRTPAGAGSAHTVAVQPLHEQSVSGEAQLGGWLLDVKTNTLLWSEEVFAIHEVPPDFVPTLEEAVHFYQPEWRSFMHDAMQTCIREGIPYNLEVEILTAKGRSVWVRTTGQAVRNAEGEITHVQGAIEEVTRRVQVEATTHRLVRQLTDIIESMTDAFFATDANGCIIYVNRRAECFLLRPRSAILGRSLTDIVSEVIQGRFLAQFRRMVKAREPLILTEYYPPRKRWVEVRAYPTEEGLAVYFRDVTEERASQVALQESEERFREIAETIEDAFWVWDPHKQRVLYVNPSYEKVFGLPSEAVYTDPYSYQTLMPADDLARLNAVLKEDTVSFTMQYRIVRPDGDERWVDVRTVPVRDNAGEVLRSVGVARDITPLVQANDQLRASAAQYQLLFTHNPHPMFVVDNANQRIMAVNQAALSHYGYSEDEFLAMTVFDLSPADERARLAHQFEQTDSPQYLGSWQHVKHDGTLIDVEIHSTRLQFNGRDATLALVLDVTERHRNEARIREQAELLDQATDAIVVRGLDGRITYWNKSAERLYGWPSDDVIGRKATEVKFDDVSAFEEATRVVTAQGKWTGELTHVTRDGRKLMVESRWTLVHDELGNPRAVFAINSDITERKKLEQQFLRAQRMESIGTLAGGIAHDLNNVLSPILLSLGMLRMTPRSEREGKLLDTLEQSAQRGADMLRQVLSFARGIEGERAPVDLATLLDELYQIVRETFDRNIRVAIRADADLWRTIGDRTQIHQVLLNLCVNARDAMPNGGALYLRAHNVELDAQYASMHPDAQVGPYVCIDVADTGIGIPNEIVDRIFEPFFTTKEQGKGTGLGLATVQAVVKSHGGLVTVDSEEGRGTEFHIYLPAWQEEEIHKSVATSDELPRGQGEWVLVVDDEPAVRSITQETLETFGYHVLVAEDGAAALAVYAQRQAEIAVVLTDMMMPVMDGYAMIQALRRINPAVKVIAASGLTANGMMTKAAKAGVHHFLQKPYTAKTMLQKLAEVLQ